MTSVLDKIVRLPRYIKIRSTNGIDENTAITDRDKQNYYSKNRDRILEKKKAYNEKNKERIASYHRQYYLDHKLELNLKHREWYKIKKNESSKMSRT